METIEILQIKKLDPKAFIPQKGSEKAAGYDIFSNQETVVPPHGKALVKTGISMAVPSGNYGRIAPRSGLACKFMIDVGAGVIDEDYRGEVGVLLFNYSDTEFKVNHGDRIAQLIIEKIAYTQVKEVEELTETVRGAGGFGSTGFTSKINTTTNTPLQENILLTQAENLKKRKFDEEESVKLQQQQMVDEKENAGKHNDSVWQEKLAFVLFALQNKQKITLDQKEKYSQYLLKGEIECQKIFESFQKTSDIQTMVEKFDTLIKIDSL